MPRYSYPLTQDTEFTLEWFDGWRLHKGNAEYPNAKVMVHDNTITQQYIVDVDLNGDGSADLRQTISYQRSLYNETYLGHLIYDIKVTRDNTEKLVEGVGHTKIHFGPGNDLAEDYYYIDSMDSTSKGLGIDETIIETQDKAQKALLTLNDAIITKDKARAYFGAIQNRLENTIANLRIQVENEQAAESRISDVDVADEVTNFTNKQILVNAAVAMLSQANSIPQMALQLLKF
jgi:flagellin-like hook-associated protein FlgL